MSHDEQLDELLRTCENFHTHGREEGAISVIIQLIKILRDRSVKTNPPPGKKKITNLYVEDAEGTKLRVEYEE